MNKRINKKELINKKTDLAERDEINKRLITASKSNIEELYNALESSEKGKTRTQIKTAIDLYGDNNVTYSKEDSLIKRLIRAFINPFTLILIALAVVSAFTDIILVDSSNRDFATVIIIFAMVLISGVLRFVQETRSGNAAEKLLEMIETTANVERIEEGSKEIPLDEIVVGDIIHFSAGDMIPADIRIIKAKDLFISQSALTGESDSIEKTPAISKENGSPLEMNNLAFMGTTVISGYAIGIVISTGNDTIFGEIAQELNDTPTVTSFEKGVNSVSWVLIKFMMIMVPIVFF